MPQLLEFTRLAPQGVDRAAGLLRGVKVLGLESRNGRSYLPRALAEAAPLYEGAKVNVDHPSGHPTAPRAYRDRLGALRGVRIADDGLYADLHFNPAHPLAEQLAWDAQHAPDNVGLSHNVQAVTSNRDGRLVVESITRVESVDLVTNPATTRGLFAQAPQSPPVEEPAMSVAWQELTLDALRANRPDLAQSLLEEQSARHAADLAQRDRLQAELDALRVREALSARRANIHRLLAQARLPQEAASELFLEQLLAADEPECARLIADRQKLVEQAWSQAASSAPRSRDQHGADRPTAPLDALTFARLLY